MKNNPLRDLLSEGVSVWLDYLSRDLVKSGRLQRFIDEDGLRGETSNPTIFQKAISEGTSYDDQIQPLLDKTADEIAWELMSTDVQSAARVFHPLFKSSQGADGYVSLELHPALAHDTKGSLKQARELKKRVDNENVMFKVPGTVEGIPVIRQLVYEGFNINVTLLFATQMYEAVMEAYISALEQRLEEGKPIAHLASVASFFVSRVDTEADKRMDARVKEQPDLKPKIDSLRGKIAVANARVAYATFEEKFSGPRWEKLKGHGAKVQRPLWASTGTKNKAYSDTLYVAELIGPDCVNTMPEETMDAFRDHGVINRTLTAANAQDARQVLKTLEEVGLDLKDITMNTLVKEGVEKFEQSYRELIDAVARERSKLVKIG